jgi:hypothetical protein
MSIEQNYDSSLISTYVYDDISFVDKYNPRYFFHELMQLIKNETSQMRMFNFKPGNLLSWFVTAPTNKVSHKRNLAYTPHWFTGRRLVPKTQLITSKKKIPSL